MKKEVIHFLIDLYETNLSNYILLNFHMNFNLKFFVILIKHLTNSKQ